MTKAASLARTTQHDPAVVAVLRIAIVTGSALALIMARCPLPF
ncbi:hypothetical protein [Blastomonas sp.]